MMTLLGFDFFHLLLIELDKGWKVTHRRRALTNNSLCAYARLLLIMRFIGNTKLVISPSLAVALIGCVLALARLCWTRQRGHTRSQSQSSFQPLRWKKFVNPHFLPFNLSQRPLTLLGRSEADTCWRHFMSLPWGLKIVSRPGIFSIFVLSGCSGLGVTIDRESESNWLLAGSCDVRPSSLVTGAPPARPASVESFLCQSLRVGPGPGNSGPTPAPMSRISTRSSWQVMS